MALIEINLNPSRNDLKYFGLIMLALFALLGGIVQWSSGPFIISSILWGFGAGFSVIYYLVRPLRLPLYRGWMKLIYPVGWTLSHLFFGVIYFLLMTPIGLLLRLFGHDAMRRKVNKPDSYWIMRKPDTDMARYFKQF
jgi:hypothetical protein